jgi:hypothetical protein
MARVVNKTIREAARDTRVCREVDVAVVGGGPGGFASAVAAARNGADTVLIERYGHLGGMASGGLVNIFPNLSTIGGEQQIYGLNQELLDRLDARGGTSYPKKEDWGTTDEKVVNYYLNAHMANFFVRNDPDIGKRRVMYSAVVDPEILKAELNDMVLESGVDLLLHSWGTEPIMEGNTARGVIFESKSGRQAILAKVVIDSTGDGDMFIGAGAEYDAVQDNKYMSAWIASVWWIANVDIKKYEEFVASQTDKHDELMKECAALGGHPRFTKGILENQEGVVWFHCIQPEAEPCDPKDVETLTRVDIKYRKKAMITLEFLKKRMPGFEKCFMMLTAPQLGVHGGSRVIGEYTLTEDDLVSDEIFEDTIAVFASNDYGDISHQHPTLCIPYRCLVPKKTDSLLVACRGFSSDLAIQQQFRIIPPCICYGQAAGTAAAMAVKAGIQPRNVNYKELQANLKTQGVYIPETVGIPGKNNRSGETINAGDKYMKNL